MGISHSSRATRLCPPAGRAQVELGTETEKTFIPFHLAFRIASSRLIVGPENRNGDDK
ncbi:MAG: hypothetical protein QOD99_528 [Chthoniobacter sp.]|jgi:hypothetical protein|nr:hypothetical protein [Chthoniobacter sp.]